MSDEFIMEELRAIRKLLSEQAMRQLDLHDAILKVRRGQIEAAERMRLQDRIERIERHLEIRDG